MNRVRGVAFGLVVASLLAFVPASADLAPPVEDLPETWVAERLLVGFDALPADRDAFAASVGARHVGGIDELNVLILEVDPALAPAVRAAASAAPGVRYVEHDKVLSITYTPNDVLYSQQYAPRDVKLPAAWDRTLGSHNRMIAIVDTGIDKAHADLVLNICHQGAAFLSGTGTGVPAATQDDNGHGTHVAGIAAAQTNNVEGIAGASQACLMPVKALNSAGLGFYSDISAAIRYAADNGANVISMSIGGDSADSTLSNAVSYARGKGVVTIAAAGNDGGCRKQSSVDYPGRYVDLAVSALNSGGSFASYSSCGNEVDIAAPGTSILSTFTGNSYLILSGTSMATPLVSGIAALAWSCNTGLSGSQIVSNLKSNADSVGLTAAQQGSGRVDAAGSAASAGC